MEQVHARFFLYEDARIKVWNQDGYVEGLKVRLGAVKGEPFGSATPMGSIDMHIANQDACEIFRNSDIGQEYDVIFTKRETNDTSS